MTDQITEPTTGDAVLMEDSEEAAARMRELEERLEARGDVEPEGDVGTRGGFGSAATMIAQARTHIGYREGAGNDTPFNHWFGAIPGYGAGGYGYPWCHSFQSFCLAHSDNADAGPRTAGCSVGVDWFQQKGRYGQTPHVGDLVYYWGIDKATGKRIHTHVELVTAVAPDQIQTIGGNTGGSLSGQYFNGDGVYEKWVSRASKIDGYGSPVYSVEDTTVPAGAGGKAASGGGTPVLVTPMTSIRTIKQQQVAANHVGFRPELMPNDQWSARTEAGVKFLQTKVGVTPDGQWGNDTENAFKAWKAAND